MSPAVVLLFLKLVECDVTGTTIIFVVSLIMCGGSEASNGINATDLGPNFAGTLYGLVNIMGSIPSFLAPMIVGALTKNNVRLKCIFMSKTFNPL